MTRARAAALALVNWKGVFYERYLLDPNVTALEGAANGAGKTTVMIAAYVVLEVPDMSRLRFSNASVRAGPAAATKGSGGDSASRAAHRTQRWKSKYTAVRGWSRGSN